MSEGPSLEVFVRDGYRLSAWTQIALPIRRSRIRVLVEEQTEFPDTIRFLLRVIDAELTAPEEIASFLGLEKGMAEAIVVQAYEMDLVAIRRDGSLAMTNEGAQQLHEASQLRRYEEAVDLAIDRLTKKALPWQSIPDDFKLRNRDLRDLEQQSGQDLPVLPHPDRPPTLSDLDERSGARGAIEHSLRLIPGAPRLLEILGIEKGQEAWWRTDAFALHLTPLEGGPTEWDVVIGSALSEEHAIALVEWQRRKRKRPIQILPEPEEVDVGRLAFGIEHDEVDRALRADWDKRTSVAVVESEVERLNNQAATAPEDTDVTRVTTRIHELERELDEILKEPTPSSIQILTVHEHRPFLLDQISRAQHRILIVSPWISPDAFDDELESQLIEALGRGVYVAIRYGYDDKGIPSSIARRFSDIARHHPRFDAKDSGNIHTKSFAVDDRFATLGSFNWLSFRGDPRRTFREEKSYVVWGSWAANKEFADALDPEAFFESLPPPADPTMPETRGVLFVEGWTDKRYMEIASGAAGFPGLLSDIEIRHVKGGAKGAAGHAISFAIANPDTPMLALFDSDEIGRSAAKDVKRLTPGGARVVLQYHEFAEAGLQDAEAEDLFPPSLVREFVNEFDERDVIDGMTRTKDGSFRYSIAGEAKESFVDWLDQHVAPQHTERWLRCIKAIRSRMRIDAE